MAVATTNITSGNTTNATSAATTSITPVANRLYLMNVISRTAITTDPNQPTATGAGLTWVVEKSVVYDNTGASRKRLTVFRALGPSPSAGALTIDFGAQTQTNIAWIIDEFTGADTSGTNGSGAVVQS